MKLFSAFAIIVTILQQYSVFVIAEDVQVVSSDEAKKMSIKQLKTELKKRGLECKGCAEKDDFVQMFLANQHLEAKISVSEKATASQTENIYEDELNEVRKKFTEEQNKKKEIDDIMEKLRASGMGGAKMFTKDDIEKMGAEGMSREFGGDRSKRSKKKSNNNNNKKEKKVQEETIEL